MNTRCVITIAALINMIWCSGNAAEPSTPSTRRVVTALDKDGKAVVLFDSAPLQPVATAASGPVAHVLWTLPGVPATASPLKDMAEVKLSGGFGPEPGAAVIKTVDFPPTTAELDKSLDVNMTMKMVGNAAPKKGRPPTNSAMHRTKTIDFAVVISGEIDMVLDDSSVHLKAGDVVIQQETNHAWVNHSKAICRITFMQVAANEP